MPRTLTLALLALAAVGCASRGSSPHAWNFAVEGRLSAITAADVAAVVAAMDARKIYRLRVISHDRVEVDTSPERYTVVRRAGSPPEVHSVEYTAVERVCGVWTAGEHFFTVF